MLDALYEGYRAAAKPATTAPTRMITMIPGEKAMRSITVSGTASDRAIPISVPTMIPTMAPNVDTMIASQRTVRRVLRLFIPTARIRPISRVRSNTPRASVIEMPRTAMRMANVSSPVMTRRSGVDLALLGLAELGVALHLGLREGGHRRLDGGPALLRRDALGELGDDEEVPGHGTGRRARACRARSASSRPARRPRRCRRPGRVSSTPFWNVTSTGSPTCRSRSFAGSLWTMMPPSAMPWKLALDDVDVDELLEGERVDGADRLGVAVDLGLAAAHGGHRGELGELGERLGDRRRQALERLVGDDVVGLDASPRGSARTSCAATSRTPRPR